MTGLSRALQISLVLLAGLGTYAGLRLSLEHFKHGEVCPALGPVPACIIVCLGYLCVVLTALNFQKKWSTRLFYAGWLPVFLLALAGVFLELTRGETCPVGAYGIPQCFYSLAMAVAAWALFKVMRSQV